MANHVDESLLEFFMFLRVLCVLTLNSVHANMHVFGLDALGGFIVTVADITPEKRAGVISLKEGFVSHG
jgi:predicted hydrolase (HD superfamily)